MRIIVPVVVTLAALWGAGRPLKSANLTLLDAIRANDNDRVQNLLGEGADPNSKDESQKSALMLAALYAGPRVLDLLMRAGADLKHRDKDGMTALVWAAHSYKTAKLLIDAGADINVKSNIGGTPLLTAAAYPGNKALIHSLVFARP